MTQADMFAHKLCALLDRETITNRDIFDGWFFMDRQSPVNKNIKWIPQFDLLINNKVLIEIKSIEILAPVHFAQTLTYLKMSNLKLGLLTNVTFLEPVMKNEIVAYISVIDISLIPLKKSPLFKRVIPSKIIENAAMEKPILLGVDGVSRGIMEKYNAGLYFEPENESDFLEKIKQLKEDKENYLSCQKGCKKLAKDLNRKNLANDMLAFMKEVAQK